MYAFQHVILFSFFLFFSLTTHAHTLIQRSELNGPCTGAGGNPGVCIKTSDCTQAGGSYISNACPGTPNNINAAPKPAVARATRETAASHRRAPLASPRPTNALALRISNAACQPVADPQHRIFQPPARVASGWRLTEQKPLSMRSRGR
jgi:hypothetical protein